VPLIVVEVEGCRNGDDFHATSRRVSEGYFARRLQLHLDEVARQVADLLNEYSRVGARPELETNVTGHCGAHIVRYLNVEKNDYVFISLLVRLVVIFYF